MHDKIRIGEIEKKYSPLPFWSWNENLDVNETRSQIREMDAVGMGGFFMHARGGLQTEYMGEDWFANVEASIGEAEKLGMRPWVYDENGWPSGFGNGQVNGLGVAYQQKHLRMEDSPEHLDTQICKSGDHYFYYEVNPHYVDTLDKKVVREFINRIYSPYYERFGNAIEGFFTDEPEVADYGIAWSFVLEEEYQKRYQDDLLKHLEELFLPKGDYKTTRIRFWKMVTDLFSESYVKQIYDWCEERGLKLTGHLVSENFMTAQVTSSGACMPHYEYFHIPGMDWLGRRIYDCVIARQVSSVAEQLGKEAVLSETYALCGHNISFAELKGIYEWQMVRGVNLLCPHLQGYSLRGMRKRDYPPAMYYQQPWWSEYDKWIDAVSRIGMILNEGKKQPDVLLLHPQTTVWSVYSLIDKTAAQQLDKAFVDVIRKLEEKHVLFHLGDETIMERHAEVKDGRLVIGRQAYSCVVMDCCQELLEGTRKLLQEFEAQGGRILSADEVADNPVTDNRGIAYTKRIFDGYAVHYFVNSSAEEQYARINVQGKMMDIYTGELEAFSGKHRFEPWGSLLIFEDDGEAQDQSAPLQEVCVPEETCIAAEDKLYLDGTFTVKEGTLNALTFDKCDYYFDGELQEKDGYILNICERANKLEREVRIRMDFIVKAEAVPQTLFLVTETPEKFRIRINDREIDKTVAGYFRDKSFQKIDIRKYFRVGENTITYECDFVQSREFYENLKKAWQFQSERNKLTYDTEIEAIYLVGDFGVKTAGEWTELERHAVRYSGDFVISEPVRKITLSHIEQQGFPFFSGELSVEGEMDVQGENPVLVLDFNGINAVRIEVGALQKTVLTDDRISLRSVNRGRHKIRLTLINNLRNLLGPHHLEEGESYLVRPNSFYKEECVWSKGYTDKQWNEDYCFVKMGR